MTAHGWTSTLGAPLTEAEEDAIQNSFSILQGICDTIYEADPDPVEMLNHVTDLIMQGWHVRRAIDDAWFCANRRAFPTTTRVKPTLASTARIDALANDLRSLGFTPGDLEAAILKTTKESQ
jgi:hypothetical protein